MGRSGRDFVTAAVAGYEVGIRVGEFLGRSHYKVFHTTGTAGTVAAAAAAGRVLGLSADAMQHAFGSAGTQAAGLWEFLRDAADSKQLHTAKAASDGLTRRVSRAGRLHRRAAHPRRSRRAWRPACRPTPIRRASPTGWASAGRSPRRRSSSTRRAGTRIPAADALLKLVVDARPRARRHRARHRARASGGDRRAGPGRRPADGAPGEVLDGHGAGRHRDVPARRARGVRAALPRSARRRVSRARADGAGRRGRGRLSAAVDRQGRGRDARRAHAVGARRRAEGRSRQHAVARRDRGEGAAPRRIQRRRDAGRDARRDRDGSSRSPRRRASGRCCRCGVAPRRASPTCHATSRRDDAIRIANPRTTSQASTRARRRGTTTRRRSSARGRSPTRSCARFRSTPRWTRSSTAPAPASSASCCGRGSPT